jgi:hypothetical protein
MKEFYYVDRWANSQRLDSRVNRWTLAAVRASRLDRSGTGYRHALLIAAEPALLLRAGASRRIRRRIGRQVVDYFVVYPVRVEASVD